MRRLSRRRALGIVAAAPLACAAAIAQGCSSGETREVDIAAFGGAPERNDNSTALRRALEVVAARGGGVIRIAPGRFRFASASIGRGGIVLPANVTIRGAGRDATTLAIVGDAVCNLFVATDRGGILFEDLAIVGNNVAMRGASVYGSGAAIRWLASAAATRNSAGFTLRRVHLENFRGPYWVDIENASPASELSEVTIEDVSFRSRSGNSPGPADITLNSAAICLNAQGGAIRHVRVTRLSGDARHIKTGIILYHAVIDALLDQVEIDQAGQEGATDDAGGYAIQIYDNRGRMTGVTVNRPILRAPRSAGLYVAGGRAITIVDPIISGQTDPQDGTLPKGAIVLNGTRQWRVTGGTLSGNWRDLDIAMPLLGTARAPVRIDAQVSGVRAEGSQSGIVIRHAAGHVAAGIAVSNCHWRTTRRTVLVENSAGPISAEARATSGYIDDIVFADSILEAGEGYRAIDLWGNSGSPAGGYAILRCTLSGTNPLFARDQGGSLRVAGCTITDRGTLPGMAAATLVGCAAVSVEDCTLRSPGRDGIGIDLGGSAGAVRGLRFVDCARTLPSAVQPPQLGRGRPRFAGKAGQHVQNLEPRPGTPAGWTNDGGTRWREV